MDLADFLYLKIDTRPGFYSALDFVALFPDAELTEIETALKFLLDNHKIIGVSKIRTMRLVSSDGEATNIEFTVEVYKPRGNTPVELGVLLPSLG
jgi:hypothetical protein